MEAIRSSDTSVLTRVTLYHIPEDDILLIFGEVLSCSKLKVNRRLGEKCSFHRQDRRIRVSTNYADTIVDFVFVETSSFVTTKDVRGRAECSACLRQLASSTLPPEQDGSNFVGTPQLTLTLLVAILTFTGYPDCGF
jgi:hypothetical protein